MKYLVLSKKLNCWCFGVGIDHCSQNCELVQNGLLPYCQTSINRLSHKLKPRLTRSEKLLKSESFVKVIDREVKQTRSRLIRIYDYGDLSCTSDLIKWVEIAELNPKLDFWLSTRQDFILNDYFVNKGLKKPDNLNIRYSEDEIKTPEFLIKFLDKYGITRSIITDDIKKSDCNASKTGSCGVCVDCWDTSKKLITYLNHGLMKYRLRDYLRFFKL